MNNYTLYKYLIILIKYIPIVGAGCMLIHVIQLLLGFDPLFAHFVFGFSILGTLLLILASYTLQFCNVHRAFILYDFIVENCIKLEQEYGFGENLTFARWIVLIIGICLFIWFIYAKLQRSCRRCLNRLRKRN